MTPSDSVFIVVMRFGKKCVILLLEIPVAAYRFTMDRIAVALCTGSSLTSGREEKKHVLQLMRFVLEGP